MKRFLPLLMLTGLLFGQDTHTHVLIKGNGNTKHEGSFKESKEKKETQSKFSKNSPSVLIDEIILESVQKIIKDDGNRTNEFGNLCASEYRGARIYHTLDINGDNNEDYLVFTTIEGLGCGASDYSFYVTTILNENNTLNYENITKIGGKGNKSIDFKYLSIKNDRLYFKSREYAPDGSDPLCCPSIKNKFGLPLSSFSRSSQDCKTIIQEFSHPEIVSKAVSPDKTFQLTVNDNGSVSLENLETGTNTIISPEALDDCGSLGCLTPERRVLFTQDGRYAITTSAFKGGPTIIWETTNWTDITEKVKNNENVGDGGLIGGGYFRLSPNGQYLAIMRNSWKFGIGLSIVNLDNFTSKIISGMYWTTDVNRVSGLKLNDNEFWLSLILMDREDYNFSFSNDSKTLIIKKNNNEYILYDVNNHSLSTCFSENVQISKRTNKFDSLKAKIINDINTLKITEVEQDVKNCCDYTNQDSDIIISYKLIEDFQKAIKSNNKSLIADFISYPIKVKLSNSMVTLYDQSELLKVYDDVFTKTLRDNINQSDFGCVGCRGIMISYGQIWFDFSGKIIAINN